MGSKESMKLAISNIAFGENQQEALKRVSQCGVEGLVIAPTMIWSDLPGMTDLSEKDRRDRLKTMEREAGEYRKRLGDLGLAVVGLQSLTYATKGMALFGSDNECERLAKHLEVQAILAGNLGADSMAFGSPGLRNPGELSSEQAMEVVAKLFGRAAVTAHDNNTQIAIEPLSTCYNNKTVKDLSAAMELADHISHPGFGIRPDTAAMSHANDAPAELISAVCSGRVSGIDISAPNLDQLSLAPEISQERYVDALRDASYQGWLSLEMKGPLSPDVIDREIKYIQGRCGL